HCLDNSFAQVIRQRFRHPRSPHRRNNADRLPHNQPNRIGNHPDSNPTEFAQVWEAIAIMGIGAVANAQPDQVSAASGQDVTPPYYYGTLALPPQTPIDD